MKFSLARVSFLNNLLSLWWSLENPLLGLARDIIHSHTEGWIVSFGNTGCLNRKIPDLAPKFIYHFSALQSSTSHWPVCAGYRFIWQWYHLPNWFFKNLSLKFSLTYLLHWKYKFFQSHMEYFFSKSSLSAYVCPESWGESLVVSI